jgi:multisubunit Na+/H+ antiporter MnhB subunit
MRDFGAPTHTEMDDYFIANSQIETGANNVVTSIVFDYRGYDTLGEATVLFAAVSGVLVSMRVALDKKEGGRKR